MRRGQRRECRIGVGHPGDVHLPAEQGFVAARLDTAGLPRKQCSKARTGHDRRLLDDHRHQVIAAVDEEIRCDRKRQAKDANDIFDHAIGTRRHQHLTALAQQLGIGSTEETRALQLADALGEIQAMHAADP